MNATKICIFPDWPENPNSSPFCHFIVIFILVFNFHSNSLINLWLSSHIDSFDQGAMGRPHHLRLKRELRATGETFNVKMRMYTAMLILIVS
jgi:hypothetical protein